MAALLALSAQLAAQQLNYGLELIAFNNEEYLPLGDDAYCRECETTLDTALAAINFDGIGAATGTNTVCAVSGSAAFTDWVSTSGREFPGVASVPPWPESNHSTFRVARRSSRGFLQHSDSAQPLARRHRRPNLGR